MVDESNTFRSYVKCSTCGNKAYAVTGETETYYCSYCEMKFTNDETPKTACGKRVKNGNKIKPLYPKKPKQKKVEEDIEPKEEDLDEIEEEQTLLEKGIENMAKSKNVAICKGCDKEKTIIAKGLCGTCYVKQRRGDSGDKKTKDKRSKNTKIEKIIDTPIADDCSGICDWSGHCILEQRGLPSAICSNKKIIKG